jgi:predicted N-acetyltransferase YhbS
MSFQIRQATESDWTDIHDIIIEAFGSVQGSEIAELVADLLADESAAPRLSLVATASHVVAGHILFTNTKVDGSRRQISSSILAPLAVRPGYQGQGIGGRLISEGIAQLRASGVDLVFVLGHPGYYPEHGFSPAGARGFEAPYPIPPENADAWMVQELRSGTIDSVSGQVVCARALNDPRHWRE